MLNELARLIETWEYASLCFENDTAGILTLNVLTILSKTYVFSKVKLTSKLTSHSSNSFDAFKTVLSSVILTYRLIIDVYTLSTLSGQNIL